MKAIVDAELCTGCELCVSTCPELFEMSGDIAKVKIDPVPDAQKDCAKQAVEDCPAVAIKVED